MHARNSIIVIIAYLVCLCNCTIVCAYDVHVAHPVITEKAVNRSQIQNYLINNMSLAKGTTEVIKGEYMKAPEFFGENTWFSGKNTILDWLKTGASNEDAPACRAKAHFHNPVHAGDWRESQLTGSIEVDLACGSDKYSNVTWATGSITPNGPFITRNGQELGWDNARSYFYEALTTSNLATRELQLAKTFRTIGHVMHLLQDASVPAHVRNDMTAHLWSPPTLAKNPYELYVAKNIDAITISPVDPTFASPLRLTDLWDANVYNGDNPSAGTDQGLAEYSNANFVSDYTVFAPALDVYHYFKYPKKDTSVQKVDYLIKDPLFHQFNIHRKYYKKIADGETNEGAGYRLAGVGYLPVKLPLWILVKEQLILPPMDEYVHADYARLILPRAVGYSAALLDYFFRGKIDVTFNPGDVSFRSAKITAQNDTPGETMGSGEARLVIRYKQLAETPLGGNKYLLGYPAEGTSLSDYSYKVSKPQNVDLSNPLELSFDFSDDPLPQFFGEMTMQLVFKGKLGNEEGAVALSKLEPIEGIYTDFSLSLPPSGVFSKITTTENAFSELRVTAKTDMPGGLSLPDGKFELALEYREAKSSPFQSEPVETEPEDGAAYLIRIPEANGVAALTQGTPVELVFDLASVPLPYSATHVELTIIYSGTGPEGTPAISAVGYRDISEPTPVDLFNNTDKVCIKGSWYSAGSPEALKAADENGNGNGFADESDIFPHNITDIFYRGSSSEGTAVIASPTSYNLLGASAFPPGAFRRLGYILTDYSFRYNISEIWQASDEDKDLWTHLPDNETTPGTAVRNDDSTYPSMYSMRGVNMWWGAGTIYDNHNYPEEPDCSWDTLQ